MTDIPRLLAEVFSSTVRDGMDPEEALQAAVNRVFPDATDEYRAAFYAELLDLNAKAGLDLRSATQEALASVH